MIESLEGDINLKEYLIGDNIKVKREIIKRKEFTLYYEFKKDDFPISIETKGVIQLILTQLIPLHLDLKHALEVGQVVNTTIQLREVGKFSDLWYLKVFFYIEMP